MGQISVEIRRRPGSVPSGNQQHGSLGGETPNQAWSRLVAEYGTPPLRDGLALRKAFGRPLQRALRGDGVLFAGLTYSCGKRPA